jgi:hypothetical protein
MKHIRIDIDFSPEIICRPDFEKQIPIRFDIWSQVLMFGEQLLFGARFSVAQLVTSIVSRIAF